MYVYIHLTGNSQCDFYDVGQKCDILFSTSKCHMGVWGVGHEVVRLDHGFVIGICGPRWAIRP